MVSIGSDLSRVTGEGLEVAPDTGIAGTRAVDSGEKLYSDSDSMRLWRIRSSGEDDATTNVQGESNLRR